MRKLAGHDATGAKGRNVAVVRQQPLAFAMAGIPGSRNSGATISDVVNALAATELCWRPLAQVGDAPSPENQETPFRVRWKGGCAACLILESWWSANPHGGWCCSRRVGRVTWIFEDFESTASIWAGDPTGGADLPAGRSSMPGCQHAVNASSRDETFPPRPMELQRIVDVADTCAKAFS